MQKIFRGLNYMHSKSLIHRDIKLENILLETKINICQAKITDFGFSTKYHNYNLFKNCGTPGYIAPEILLDKDYNCKVDIFSAGIILFTLLTGASPWKGYNSTDLLKKNRKGIIEFKYEDWKDVSFSARHLVKKMLYKKPSKRYNVK